MEIEGKNNEKLTPQQWESEGNNNGKHREPYWKVKGAIMESQGNINGK
jgi:hypothetical protein